MINNRSTWIVGNYLSYCRHKSQRNMFVFNSFTDWRLPFENHIDTDITILTIHRLMEIHRHTLLFFSKILIIQLVQFYKWKPHYKVSDPSDLNVHRNITILIRIQIYLISYIILITSGQTNIEFSWKLLVLILHFNDNFLVE